VKQIGITAVLMLLLVITFGATSAKAADTMFTVMNDSKTTVTVSVVWSGGSFPPFDLDPGKSADVTVPSAIDSVKMEVTGKCRKALETFNPLRVNRAIITCKHALSRGRLAVTKPVS